MKIYIVRHGESEGNVLNIHQFSHTPLSEIGLYQAKNVAHRFKTIPADIIIASPYLRTQQTAEAIANVTNLKIENNELLREFKRPSEIEGKREDDPEAIEIKKTLREHMHEPNWHYSDEDNAHDVIRRAKELFAQLEKRTEENIILVSHGITIRSLIGYCIFGDELTVDLFHRLNHSLRIENTGITVFRFANDKWELITCNDYAHLG